jgi:uncharacterized membrane protein YfcA
LNDESARRHFRALTRTRGGYNGSTMFDVQLQLQLLWAVPIVPVGVVVGRWLVERIDRRRFHVVSVVLLGCSGIYLVAS